MTSDAVPAGGDPRRLLADVRGLARRVRLAQRVTWLPLLVLGVVTFGVIPAHRHGTTTVSDCRTVDGVELCRLWEPVALYYWLVALALAYVLIAGAYLRVARSRGVDARVLPYVLTGVALTVLLFVAFAASAGRWLVPDDQDLVHPSAFTETLFRLITPVGGIGLALLVLAWLERHVALLLFAAVYLTVVLMPVQHGWEVVRWGGSYQDAPAPVISGGVLLLGSAGFALAQRLRRPR
jgi:hypothetical protein